MKHFRRWGAAYLLLLLFLGSWLGQFVTQLSKFRSEQSPERERMHGGDECHDRR